MERNREKRHLFSSKSVESLRNVLKRNSKSKDMKTTLKTSSESRSTSQSSRSATLATRARTRLRESRFRAQNESLSSTLKTNKTSIKSLEDFQSYHLAFKQVSNRWPIRPIDHIIGRLQSLPAIKSIADMGCGPEPLLAKAFPKRNVYSMDLFSSNPKIIVSNMNSIPLEDESIDSIVFCLSLLSPDLRRPLSEANRVLKTCGLLMITEITSRFQSKEKSFIKTLRELGFKSTKFQFISEQKMFVFFEFRKIESKKWSEIKKLPKIALKSCKYKKR
ncbi:ribosomal RNA-processing protein 8-like [Oppia nitens]|uniref:ribosomal RNA-processing protein 8-like n=1 Tax=Oppia nitens TaxID=1686743 RepID=UPI0023DC77D8|nr:ribosomal RNA-processing protein 8-like [Oppia nitens]